MQHFFLWNLGAEAFTTIGNELPKLTKTMVYKSPPEFWAWPGGILEPFVNIWAPYLSHQLVV